MNRKTRIIIATSILVIGIGVLALFIGLNFNQSNQDIELMAKGGKEANEKAQEELKKYPILKWIPYVVDEYSDDMTVYTNYEIWPEYSDDKFVVVIRDYTGGNEQAAKDVMKSWGINLADYKIEYRDLSSEYGSVKVSDN